MAESYSRIQSRIAQLQRQAEGLRRTEMAGVIKKIKVAIDAYGITADDLFGSGGGGGAGRTAGGRAPRPTADHAGGADGGTRYADGQGNIWGGRGPRPKWLRDAIGGGRALEDFSVGDGVSSAKGSSPRTTAPAKKRPSKGIAIKYRDGDNTWTGRGSQPRWLRAAMAEGKTLEQFQV